MQNGSQSKKYNLFIKDKVTQLLLDQSTLGILQNCPNCLEKCCKSQREGFD